MPFVKIEAVPKAQRVKRSIPIGEMDPDNLKAFQESTATGALGVVLKATFASAGDKGTFVTEARSFAKLQGFKFRLRGGKEVQTETTLGYTFTMAPEVNETETPASS